MKDYSLTNLFNYSLLQIINNWSSNELLNRFCYNNEDSSLDFQFKFQLWQICLANVKAKQNQVIRLVPTTAFFIHLINLFCSTITYCFLNPLRQEWPELFGVLLNGLLPSLLCYTYNQDMWHNIMKKNVQLVCYLC